MNLSVLQSFRRLLFPRPGSIRRRQGGSFLDPGRRFLATKRQQRAAAAVGANTSEASSLSSTAQLEKKQDNQPLDDRVLPSVVKNQQRLIVPPSTTLITTSASSASSSVEDTLFSLPQATELYNPEIHLPSLPQSWQGYERSTPLTEELVAWIGVTGRPISLAEFVRLALTHPQHGYYTQATATGTKHSTGIKGDGFDDDDEYYDTTTNADSSLNKRDDSNRITDTTTVIRDNDEDRIVIGPGGDFVTAPEISQIFGECLGVWYFTQWQQQQQADSTTSNQWQWLECGPGRGSLTHDFLQFAAQLSDPSFLQGCRYIHLVETSPVLEKLQRQALEQLQSYSSVKLEFVFHARKQHQSDPSTSLVKQEQNLKQQLQQELENEKENEGKIQVYWHESLAAFRYWQQARQQKQEQQPLLPTFAVCQEFLDALPLYAFEMTTEGTWRERLVDVAIRDDMLNDEEEQDHAAKNADSDPPLLQTNPKPETSKEVVDTILKPRLRIVLAPEATPAVETLLHTDKDGVVLDEASPLRRAPAGSVVEVSPESILAARDLAAIVRTQGGAALIIDYGQEGSADTIRGFAKHEQVHFLSRPGEVDVTADVDFAALKHAVNENRESDLHQNDRSASTNIARAYGPVGQGEFLVAMGMQERVIQLMERADVTDQQAENLFEAMLRLASPEEMGERYKVLGIVPAKDEESSPLPPGFYR